MAGYSRAPSLARPRAARGQNPPRCVADARRPGRRDVTGVDDAQRTVDGIAAGIWLAAAGLRVTGQTVGGDGQRAAALEQARVGLGRRLRLRGGAGGQPSHSARAQAQAQPGARARRRIGNDMRGASGGHHAAASICLAMAAAAFEPRAAMLKVLFTTLAEGIAPPPGSQRLSWSCARQSPFTTESGIGAHDDAAHHVVVGVELCRDANSVAWNSVPICRSCAWAASAPLRA